MISSISLMDWPVAGSSSSQGQSSRISQFEAGCDDRVIELLKASLFKEPELSVTLNPEAIVLFESVVGTKRGGHRLRFSGLSGRTCSWPVFHRVAGLHTSASNKYWQPLCRIRGSPSLRTFEESMKKRLRGLRCFPSFRINEG